MLPSNMSGFSARNLLRSAGRRLPALTIATGLVSSTLVLLAARSAIAAPVGPGSTEVQAVSVVIAIDESSSLSPSEVDQERHAGALIALGELAPGSSATIFGFGSSDRRGQSAIDEVCPTTSLGSVGSRESLSRCVAGIHSRTTSEGDGTDFAEAFKHAATVFAAQPRDRPKIFFLLTDGYLNVPNSERYGSLDQRNLEAGRQARATVGELRSAGVAIWPLGFGDKINFAQLQEYASGGARASCGTLAPVVPQARRVLSAADVVTAMIQAYGQARCLGISSTAPQLLPGGRSLDLFVTVPRIATLGTIAVIKSDPRVRVSYWDPQNREIGGAAEQYGSGFELAGRNGPVEALRSRDPLPGRWRVRLDAPASSTTGTVLAAALWQTVLRSSILVTPPRPRPGEAATVRMRLETRPGITATEDDLRGLSFGVELRGDGVSDPPSAKLSDDGVSPDERAGDGIYTGRVPVPSTAAGALEFDGAVQGPGAVSDGRPAYTRVAVAPQTLSAQIQVERRTAVPGGTITGSVAITNSGTSAQTVRLDLGDLRPNAGADVGDNIAFASPSTAQAPVGQSQLRFTLRVGASTRLGPVPGLIEIAAIGPNGERQVVDQAFLGVTVAYPPTLWERYRRLWSALIALVVVVAVGALWWLRRRRAARDVSALTLVLYRNGQQVHSLPAPDRPARRFPFVIANGETATPRLHYAEDFAGGGPGSAEICDARRSAHGLLTIRLRGGAPPLVLRPEAPQSLEIDGLALGFIDGRADRMVSGDLIGDDWAGDGRSSDGRPDLGRRWPRRWRRTVLFDADDEEETWA
jgi:hypothetical protein